MIPADHVRIERAIDDAHAGTDGRLAVRIIPDSEVLQTFERAAAEFQGAGLHKTEQRNAALVLVAPNARQFAVLGDAALHDRVGDSFWNQLIDEMRPQLAAGDIPGAIVHAVNRVGNELKAHFPAHNSK